MSACGGLDWILPLSVKVSARGRNSGIRGAGIGSALREEAGSRKHSRATIHTHAQSDARTGHPAGAAGVLVAALSTERSPHSPIASACRPVALVAGAGRQSEPERRADFRDRLST